MGNFIRNKQSSILDMGTGAGIPGIILAINQFTNVSLVDSNIKCILNYSQSSPKVPDGIILKPVDPISTLQSMAFHLKNEHLTNNHRRKTIN